MTATTTVALSESAPVILQDWTPIASCLDFQLGQLAFQRRGAQAFTTNEVPNLVNQGGLAAVRAAEVLFASCAEAAERDALEAEIVVVEMAIGMGVHAVQLLDRFQQRCRAAGVDWYDRLTFFATDVTPRMLQDARDRGVFERHQGRVVLAQLDARRPERVRRLDDGVIVELAGRPRLLVHTYLLCVLPANVFRWQPEASPDAADATESADIAGSADAAAGRWQVLVARTMLRQPALLERFTTLPLAELQAQIARADAEEVQDLADLYPLLDLDLSLAPVEERDLPDLDVLHRIASQIHWERKEKAVSDPVWVLHSGGAMRSIEASLDVLRPDGLLLYRDYGPGTAGDADIPHLYQHYGATTAIGINHFAIDRWVRDARDDDGAPRWSWSGPDGDERAMIKTRLLGRATPASVAAVFASAFAVEAFANLERVVANARGLTTAAAVMDGYREALRLEPENWALLGEAAEAALRGQRSLDLAEVLIREALRINPWSSAAAWNVLGDVLFLRGDVHSAEGAYRRATVVNPEHARGWFNLYLCARQRADHALAVEMAARALTMDREGAESERLGAALRDAITRLQEHQGLASKLRRERAAGSHR